jgi:hypothetical protein
MAGSGIKKVRMKDRWDKAGVFIAAIGATLVALTVIFAGCQIRDARLALEATTLYNVEKDYSDVFKPIVTEKFQKCFGKESNSTTGIAPPNPCEDPDERRYFFDLLSHYRLLLDLEQYGSLDVDYVDRRFKGACDILANEGSTDTIDVFNKKDAIDPRLIARIAKVCGGKK